MSPAGSDPPTATAAARRLRVCVLGVGGGGFQRQLREILERVRRPLELVVVLSGPHGGLQSWQTAHTVRTTYVLRGPSVWGDRRKATAWQMVTNLLRAVPILARERPDVVLAVGTAQALPFALAGRLLGVPLWFVESLTRVRHPSQTGRVLYRSRLCQRFFYYWPDLGSYYQRGTCIVERHDLRDSRNNSF